MSSLWKLYGLAAVSKTFLSEVAKLSKKVMELNETPGGTSEEKFIAAIEKYIDPMLGSPDFRCPLSHLDVQAFYDTLFNKSFWEAYGRLEMQNAFKPVPSPTKEPFVFDEYCRVIGLASTDPWVGDAVPAEDAYGFRHDLRDSPVEAIRKRGFLLEAKLAKQISKSLKKPEVFNVMNQTALFWYEGSFSNVTDRRLYGRLKNLPKGWVAM